MAAAIPSSSAGRSDHRRGWGIGGGLAAAVAAVLLVVTFADWSLLRGPIAREASRLSGRPIRIDGDLEVHPWSWTPRAVVGGLKIGQPAWAGGGLMADIPKVVIGVRLLPLLTGRLDVTLIDLERPKVWLFVDRYGRANWRLNPDNTQAAKLPPIQRFIIRDGQLGLADIPRKLTIGGLVQSHEVTRVADGGAFVLTGRGALNHRPFLLTITGAPLLNVRADRPYSFKADMRAAQTRILADGVLPRPFDLSRVNADLTVSGRDFADLYALTGLALPNTPPYRLKGDLSRNGRRYAFTHVQGVVGASDLAGDFRVDRIDNRPNLRADLHSRSLDVRDLGSLVGAPRPANQTPQERAQAAKRRFEGRILPDATLNVAEIRSTDAVLHYSADRLKADGNLPLTHVKLGLTLNHGLLDMAPLAFSLPQGDVVGRVRIDARGAAPKDDVDVWIHSAQLGALFKRKADAPISGSLVGHADLHSVGDSVHNAASSASGSVALAIPSGKIRRVLAEALGIDVSSALGLALAKNNSPTGVRCALADFTADDGVLTARDVVLDTDAVIAKARGTINLRTETLDLTLRGRPKKFRLVRVMAPITLTGQLRSPRLGVKPGAAPAQVAAAVALAVVATPVAALAPFIDFGGAKGADCAALMASAEQKHAPIKPAKF